MYFLSKSHLWPGYLIFLLRQEGECAEEQQLQHSMAMTTDQTEPPFPHA